MFLFLISSGLPAICILDCGTMPSADSLQPFY